jgi:hypothetical protein
MKTYKTLIMLCLLAVGSILLSQCKKDTETVTNTIHDTITNTIHDTTYIVDSIYVGAQGKIISGYVSYLDYNGVQTAAAGAVIRLYSGSSTTGPLAVQTLANASGVYTTPQMLPGNYFIYATYNTVNTNLAGRDINGINFKTEPGYPITMASLDLTQNLSLVAYSALGNSMIAISDADTIGTQRRKVTFNSHSKVTWESHYNQGNSQIIAGAFNTLQFNRFIFEEANPANIQFSGYVLLSSLTTYEPARDALGTGCVSKTMKVDTLNATTPDPVTDTARLYTTSVVKYGDGYLAHCMMKAYYITPNTSDTTGVPSQYWGTTIERPVDVYFTFEKKKVWNSTGTTFNWEFIFEGMFDFKAKSEFYVVSNNIGDKVTVKPHVLLRGANNVEYPN